MQDDWDNQADQDTTENVNGDGGDGSDQESPLNEENGVAEQDTAEAPGPTSPATDDVGDDDGFYSSEEEPVWRCDVCKKDFKSEGQLKNHMQSKKHKQTVKKYAAKMNMKEDEVMAEMMAALGR